METSPHNPPASLIIDPVKELKFFGPFTHVVTVPLTLTNASDRRMCFRVKSNVPQQYCVHPTIDVIEPGQQVTVEVMLQPVSKDELPDVDGSHKFLVQSTFAPDGEIVSLERLWNQTKADEIMTTKLNCVFEQPLITHLDYLIERMYDVCNGLAKEEDVVERQRVNVDSSEPPSVVDTAPLKPPHNSNVVPVFVVVVLIAIIVGVFHKFLL